MRRQQIRTTFVTAAAALTFAFGVAAFGQQGRDAGMAMTGSVDFVVVTRDGRPVTDLKMDEVTVRVNSRPRAIKSLQYIRTAGDMAPVRGGAAPAPAPPTPSVPVAPAFASNQATSADLPRSIVIVVDDESMPIGQEVRLRAALNEFVRDLPPTDRVALVTVPHGGIKVGLTLNREALRQGINTISPVTPIDPPICRTRLTLSTLETTLSNLARASEQPITVAFLSASLTGQSTMEQAPLPSRGQLTVQAGSCYLGPEDFAKVGQAVSAVRAQLYIIHPDFSQEPAREGVENLRGQTGAPLFHLSAAGSAEAGLYRMARETSGYYVATFDTEPDERVGGKTLAASVRTTRRDVELRDRPYVTIGRPAVPSMAATTTITTAFEMVRSGRAFRDLPLRATVTPSRNKDGRVTLVVAFEPADPSVVIMTASAALFDENGNAKEYWPPSETAPTKMSTWPMSIGLTVPPGTYRLRLGAIDANGRLGLVDDKVVAELQPAGPLQISGLSLGQNLATGFTPRLLFGKQTSAVAHLELYGAPEGTQVNVQFEVSKTTDGQAFYRTPGSVGATSEEGKYSVTATIPIWALDPGEYVVRAIVQVAGQPAGRVIKTLHKAG